MRLVWGLDSEVAAFVAAHFPETAERGWNNFYAAAGMADEAGVLVGGLVLSEYRGHDGCLSIYAADPRFVTPRMLGEMCRWAFVGRGFKRLTAQVAKKNKRTRRFVEGLGFRLEGTMRHGWHDGNDDMCIYGMTKEACKWLEK